MDDLFYILAIVWAAVLGVSVAASVIFDKILRRLHRTAHDVWVEIDRPSGFFWWPRDTSSCGYGMAVNWRVYLDLQGKAPAWITADADLTRWHRAFVILTRIMWGGVVVFLLLIVTAMFL